MKKYYTLKLKLTPKQIEMLEGIMAEGVTGVSGICEGDEENRMIAVERKVDDAIIESGYSYSGNNSWDDSGTKMTPAYKKWKKEMEALDEKRKDNETENR